MQAPPAKRQKLAVSLTERLHIDLLAHVTSFLDELAWVDRLGVRLALLGKAGPLMSEATRERLWKKWSERRARLCHWNLIQWRDAHRDMVGIFHCRGCMRYINRDAWIIMKMYNT